MMTKEEIYSFLNLHMIPFEKMEHNAVYNMREMLELQLPHPDAEAKNLFVRDDKKRNYYLITVKGDKRVDLKRFQAQNGTRRLSFASDNELMEVLGLIPGAVTPLGILNDNECKVHFYLDEEFLTKTNLIGVHPNDNTATVWLNPDDLQKLLRDHGNQVSVVKID